MSRGAPVVVCRQGGGLVLGFGLMPGLLLALEGNARVFDGPPLVEV